MKIIRTLKTIVEKDDGILFAEDNRSLADFIEEAIRKIDFEPKFKIKKMSGCHSLPWVIIKNGCYLINSGRTRDNCDDEVFGFQVAFKFVRIRAQKDNPEMILFTPELSTGIPFVDQTISESYFNNFDNKNETDGAISSWLVARMYIDGYPEEELAKFIKLGADKYFTAKANPKEKKIIIE
jgi:hypothetical protein